MNRYELIDSKGNMKGWVHARCEYDARESFYKSRHYKPIPKGWTVKEIKAPTVLKVGTRVKRTNMENGRNVPVGSTGVIVGPGLSPGYSSVDWDNGIKGNLNLPGYLEAIPDVPETFKVGDLVTGKVWMRDSNEVFTGEYQKTDSVGDIQIKTANGYCPYLAPKTVRRVVNTEPEVATPETPEANGIMEEITTLKQEKADLQKDAKELGHMLTEAQKDLEAARGGLIDANAAVQHWKGCYESAAFREKAEQRRANAAEAKLADIAALDRCREIINNLPEGSENWTFDGLICDIARGIL